MGAAMNGPDEKIAIPPALVPPPLDDRPRIFTGKGLSPSALLLHETVVRALQMVLNGWKKYLDDEKKRYSQE